MFGEDKEMSIVYLIEKDKKLSKLMEDEFKKLKEQDLLSFAKSGQPIVDEDGLAQAMRNSDIC